MNMRLQSTVVTCVILIALALVTPISIQAQMDESKTPSQREAPSSPSKPPAENGADRAGHAAPSVASLVARVKPSLVVITSDQVGVGERGVGAGFVVSDDGLIATNLHVIGEGMAIKVELSDGRKLPVKSIHASDRFLDLALLRVDVQGAKLTPLELASADAALSDGDDVVVIGNPHGLKNSVVKGVLSARREIDGRPMLQLAVPIEPGNSGGPVLDMGGRVHGVVTLKSTLSNNLGFAMPVDSLASMLDKPNPVSYENWRTIGRIDGRDWTPLFGADWRQLGGRIIVRRPGQGFGGRALLLSQREAPKTPYEIGVSVKLDDESGAAGLVIHSDGENRHYGFYPSGGSVRFTCFEGPTVFNWRILHNEPCQHFRPGEFNHFKVRVEKDRIRCYVNHEHVFTTQDQKFANGRVGLAKFRQTVAEFRNFEFGSEISAKSAPEELVKSLTARIAGASGLDRLDRANLNSFAKSDRLSIELLQGEAKRLEYRASQLRQLADDVHLESVISKIRKQVEAGQELDLLRLSLLIARLDDSTVDVDSYVRSVERMARAIESKLGDEATQADRMAAMNEFLFRENGFHGSRSEYDHLAKRYMHRVIDDRNGLPIMLATLYMEIGRRIGLTVEGVGLPGHFVVRVNLKKTSQLIDPFHSGKKIDRDGASRLVAETAGVDLEDEHLAAVSKQAMAVRMMMNLGALANKNRDIASLRRYLSATLAIDADLHAARLDLARVLAMTGRNTLAIGQLNQLIDAAPEGVNLRQAREMRRFLQLKQP